MTPPGHKVKTSVSLSQEARAMIDALMKKLGLSASAVVEMAVRKLFARENQ